MNEYTEKEIYEACQLLDITEVETYFSVDEREVDYDENGELVLGRFEDGVRVYRYGINIFVDTNAFDHVSLGNIDKFIVALMQAKRDAKRIKKVLNQNRQNKRKEEEDEE